MACILQLCGVGLLDWFFSTVFIDLETYLYSISLVFMFYTTASYFSIFSFYFLVIFLGYLTFIMTFR